MRKDLKAKLEDLAHQLRELAIEYNEDYLTITYFDGALIGNNSPFSDDKIDIYLEKEKRNE